jgi:hypothetical protein
MFVVPGQCPRTVAIAPQAGTEAPIGLIKKDSTKVLRANLDDLDNRALPDGHYPCNQPAQRCLRSWRSSEYARRGRATFANSSLS